MQNITILIISFEFFKLSFGYKANLFFNFSNLDVSKPYSVITFESNFTNEIFSLLHEKNSKISFKIIDGYYPDKVNLVPIDEILTIEINNRKWNFVLKFQRFLKNICTDEFTVQKIHIDDFLNEILDCRNKVTKYISRLYFMKQTEKQTYSSYKNASHMFYKRINIFWLISPSDALFFDMNRNYKVFLKDCKSVPISVFVFVIGSALALIFGILYAVLSYLIKRKNCKVFPIIMVEPIRQISTN